MKLGIIIDSSSGLSKKEANNKGWGFLPLIMNIDGKEFLDGVDITAKKFYEIISIQSNVKTSATPPGIIISEIEKFSQENDFVIIYGLSQELSSQTNNIKTFAKDFKNVHVVSSKGVAEMIVKDLEYIEKMAKNGSSKEELISKIEQLTSNQFGIAVPQTLSWLVKGGRINSGIAQMAKLTRIVPMICFRDGKLEKYDFGRVFKKTVLNATKEIKNKIDNNYQIVILHGNNLEIDFFKKSIEEIIGENVEVKLFPPIIALHIGPGVIAIAKIIKI